MPIIQSIIKKAEEDSNSVAPTQQIKPVIRALNVPIPLPEEVSMPTSI